MLFTELCSFANRAILRVVTEIQTCDANGAIGTSERSQEPTFPKMVTKLQYGIWGEARERRKGFSAPAWQKVTAMDSPGSPRGCRATVTGELRNVRAAKISTAAWKHEKLCTWPCWALLKIDVITGGITELTWALTMVYKSFLSNTSPVCSAGDMWYLQEHPLHLAPWLILGPGETDVHHLPFSFPTNLKY